MIIRSTFILLLLSVAAQASPDIEYWQTAKGSRVYFVSAPELPMVDIDVTFNAGAARDGDHAGLALFTNAMLDQGAGGLTADEIATAFADVGARFGSDAQRDMANLGLRTLTAGNAMNQALATYRKVLTQPDFPPDAFMRLRNQIIVGLRAEKQSPSALARRAYYKAIFGDHAYAAMPSGDEKSVTAITLDDIKAFYKRYYVASNAIIVIVGALNRQQAEEVADNLLAGLPAGQSVEPLAKVPQLTAAKDIVITHPSTQTHILMGQPGISCNDKDYFALYVGNHILGGSGLVSRLSDELREKRGLSYSAFSFFMPMQRLGPYQFGLQTRNDQAKEALSVMKAALKAFVTNGPKTSELVAAKQNITGGFALRIDSNSKILNYVRIIAFCELPLDYLATFKDNINAVTVRQITDAYQRRVHPDNMVTVRVGGE